MVSHTVILFGGYNIFAGEKEIGVNSSITDNRSNCSNGKSSTKTTLWSWQRIAAVVGAVLLFGCLISAMILSLVSGVAAIKQPSNISHNISTERGLHEGVVTLLKCNFDSSGKVTLNDLQTDTGQPTDTETVIYMVDEGALVSHSKDIRSGLFEGGPSKKDQLDELEDYSYLLAGSKVTIAITTPKEVTLYMYRNFTLYGAFPIPGEPIPPSYRVYKLESSSVTPIDIYEPGFYFFAVLNPHSVSFNYSFNISLYYYNSSDYNSSCSVNSDVESASCTLNVTKSTQCLLAYVEEGELDLYYKLHLQYVESNKNRLKIKFLVLAIFSGFSCVVILIAVAVVGVCRKTSWCRCFCGTKRRGYEDIDNASNTGPM